MTRSSDIRKLEFLEHASGSKETGSGFSFLEVPEYRLDRQVEVPSVLRVFRKGQPWTGWLACCYFATSAKDCRFYPTPRAGFVSAYSGSRVWGVITVGVVGMNYIRLLVRAALSHYEHLVFLHGFFADSATRSKWLVALT